MPSFVCDCSQFITQVVTKLTVSFQTVEANWNLTVNVTCKLTEYYPHFKTQNLYMCPPPPGLELIR